MISRIKGVLLEKELPNLLVDVAGIGYELQLSLNSFYHLPNLGAEVVLYTHLVVREDAQLLYGFVTSEERSLFRALIKVTGIGPKSALAILSSIEPAEFIRYVLDDDVTSLSRLPGIGKKTAQRLVIDMRDKFAHWETEYNKVVLGATDQKTGGKIGAEPSATKDAISALMALGYKIPDARRVVLKHRKPGFSSEELIRAALKELAG